jgi:TolB-like protein/Tfp pilus assembly protein PilF
MELTSVPPLPDFGPPAERVEAAKDLARVAVLPFVNLSDEPSEDYFCDGIAVELLLSLTRTPGLSAISRTSVFALKDQNLEPREAGRLLNASAVLSGAIRRADGQLEMSVELIDVASGRTLWSDQFERDHLDVFIVQDQITSAVLGALVSTEIQPEARSIERIHSSSPEAFEHYLTGRQYYYRYSRQAIETAAETFRRAIDVDDRYALAFCGLADCYSYLYLYVDSSTVFQEKALEASAHALELDADLAEAWAARGLALSLVGDFGRSESAFEKAIDLDPSLFEARFLYARVCFSQGKMEKSARLFEEANQVRPEDYQSLLLAAQAIDDLGEKTRASELRIRGVVAAQAHLRLDPRATRALYLGANGLFQLGEKQKAQQWLRKALALEPGEPMLLYNAGCIFALMGRQNRALDCLERAAEAGLRQLGWFEHDNNLDSLRGNPRFESLLDRLVY